MNMKNGYGEEVFKNGFSYKGYYKNKQLEGDCMIIFNQDRHFKGKVSNN